MQRKRKVWRPEKERMDRGKERKVRRRKNWGGLGGMKKRKEEGKKRVKLSVRERGEREREKKKEEKKKKGKLCERK